MNMVCPVCELAASACTCTRKSYDSWVGGHETAAERECCRRLVAAWLRASGRWRAYSLRCEACGKRLAYGEILAGGERCFGCARGMGIPIGVHIGIRKATK